MVDLTQFAGLITAQEEGTVVDILHPLTGESLGVKIKVAGPDSARAKSARQAVMNANLRSNPASKPTAVEIETSARKITAKSVISWEGVSEKETPLECTVDNIQRVFTDYPFIYEQVSMAAANRAGFIKS